MNFKLLVKKSFFYYLVFVFLMAMAFYLRLSHFSDNLPWCADIARDFLAGELINKQGLSPILGHWNSGIGYVYPAIYYHLIAFLESLFSFSGVSILLIIMHVLAIAGFALSLKYYFNKRISLIVAFFLSFSPLMIYLSQVVLSAYVTMIFFLFSLTFLFIYLFNKNFFALFLSTLFLAISTAIFYGALIFIPFYCLLLFTLSPFHKTSDRIVVVLNFISLFFCFYWLLFGQF